MAEIEKIVLKINDKKIELSVDEAKELSKILGDLFEEKVKIVKDVIEIDRWRPYPYVTWNVPTYSAGTYTICNTALAKSVCSIM